MALRKLELDDDTWGIVKSFLFDKDLQSFSIFEKMTRYSLYALLRLQKIDAGYARNKNYYLETLKFNRKKLNFEQASLFIKAVDIVNRKFKKGSIHIINKGTLPHYFKVLFKSTGYFVMHKEVMFDDGSIVSYGNDHYTLTWIIENFELMK